MSVFDAQWQVTIQCCSVITRPELWFNIKMTSCQYRESHCGDKTIWRPSYLHNGISYTGKMTSLYWIKAQGPDSIQGCHLTSRRNPILEVSGSQDRLLPTVEFPILVRWCLCIESGPWLCNMAYFSPKWLWWTPHNMIKICPCDTFSAFASATSSMSPRASLVALNSN